MSTTDPAPLPRLGEVFFDVRSKSRSLRISWYADTGVAVLSIWQRGTCTGSFRLPMGDLPRLIGALQAGPARWAGPRGNGLPSAAGLPPQAGYGPDPAMSGALPYLNGSGPVPPAHDQADCGGGPAAYSGPAAAGYPGYAGPGPGGCPAPGLPASGQPEPAFDGHDDEENLSGQHTSGWDYRPVVSVGAGLDPLPESHPYGTPR